MNRTDLRKRKRRKKLIVIYTVFILFALVVMPGSYFAWDYYTSYSKAVEESPVTKEPVTFKGEEPVAGKVNILLVGVDTRKEGEASNSDSMMIAQYDSETKKAKIVSLMRDMFVGIPGKSDKYRLNAAYLMGGGKDGAELLRQTIKQNFDVDLNYYAIIDFMGFSKAIDQAFPEGIEINVEQQMSEGIGMTLKPGLQRLHGKELLAYSRFRKDAQSDFGRVKRQQEVIDAISEELNSFHGVTKLPGMIGTVLPYISTNYDTTKILSVLSSFLLSGAHQRIEKLTIPIDGSFEDELVNKAWVLQIDVEKNKEALNEFLNGA
ncbi:LCP family protein [Bacillus testis]|uniref:LCP family protein n=1 Tax=Bacillus testis TaxID=1622072 RepID=UPI00067E7210|nr:LCP family protein [Bacillus testis]